MPNTTEIPGNALYDNLRDTGRTTAGLAQQQTQIFQDWTRIGATGASGAPGA